MVGVGQTTTIEKERKQIEIRAKLLVFSGFDFFKQNYNKIVNPSLYYHQDILIERDMIFYLADFSWPMGNLPFT